MNSEDFRLAFKLAGNILRYKNHINEIIIQPMCMTYGRDNYNLRVIIQDPFRNTMQNTFYYSDAYNNYGRSKNTWEEKIISMEHSWYYTTQQYVGNSGFNASSMIEFYDKAKTIKEFLITYFSLLRVLPELDIVIKDYGLQTIKDKDIYKGTDIYAEMFMDEYMAEKFYYRNLGDSKRNKKYKHIFGDKWTLNDKFKFGKSRYYSHDYDSYGSKYVIKNIDELLHLIDNTANEINNRINRLVERFNTAYDDYLIGKIRSGTALTKREVENNPGLRAAFKEFKKLESITKDSTILIN